MFFNKPKISRTWKSDSGTGYLIEDDADRKVVLWFDSDSEDFIKARAGGGGMRIVPDSDLELLALKRQQAQAGLPLGAGLVGLGNLFGR